MTELDLEPVEHRSDRFMARLAGKQQGSTPIAAQQSALDVPDLLAEVRRLKAVELAAKVWRTARHDEISGDVFHRACVALSEAVAALNGDLDRAPVAPPSEEELEGGRELVRRAKAYSASLMDPIMDKLRGNAPVESAPAAKTPSCDEPVWDGPYKMRCGRLMPKGECMRHGKPSAGAASPATSDTTDGSGS